jgi:hypothetical protein
VEVRKGDIMDSKEQLVTEYVRLLLKENPIEALQKVQYAYMLQEFAEEIKNVKVCKLDYPDTLRYLIRLLDIMEIPYVR